MSTAHWAGSIALGLALFAVPFLRYAHPGGAIAPHTDHRPRNGGVLQMIGDYHLEVRRRMGQVEVFVSDANRTPVRARSGWLSVGGAPRERLHPGRDRLTAPDPSPHADLRVEVELEDASVLVWDFGAVPSG